jgi:hypothetical protein
MRGIEEVEHATRKREHRKSADTARTSRIGFGEKSSNAKPTNKLYPRSRPKLAGEGAETMEMGQKASQDW